MIELSQAVVALVAGISLLAWGFRRWRARMSGCKLLFSSGYAVTMLGLFGLVYTLSSPWFHRPTLVEAAIAERLTAAAPEHWDWFMARPEGCLVQVTVPGREQPLPVTANGGNYEHRDYVFAKHRGEWFGFSVETKATQVSKQDLQAGVDECIQALKANEASRVAAIGAFLDRGEQTAAANRASYDSKPTR